MVAYIVAGFFFIWLVILSYFVFRAKNHYHKLIKHTKGKNIEEILDKLVENDSVFHKELDTIKKELHKLTLDSYGYFQKIGIVRFNPFGRTSSDQSFVLSLLNNEDSGVIINFIYTHEGIRVYTKKVKKGKGEEYELSDEEKHAVKNAN
ncbi:MAG: DUF4446 family protein [Candidatus Roizmanbacteria bacterium]|nr:MAG: DUF4446 family protein [Candidatus Roizmanbacteria bacterium]